MGSSLGMTIPAFFAKYNQIGKGSELKTLYDNGDFMIICSESNKEETIQKLRRLMEELKQRENGK